MANKIQEKTGASSFIAFHINGYDISKSLKDISNPVHKLALVTLLELTAASLRADLANELRYGGRI